MKIMLLAAAFIGVTAPYIQAHESTQELTKTIAIRESASPRAEAIEYIEAGSTVQIDSSRNPRRGYLPVFAGNGEPGWVWPGDLQAKGQSLFDTARIAEKILSQQGLEASLPSARETRLLADIRLRERFLTNDSEDAPHATWALRSQHTLFGMPETVDNRHNFKPIGFEGYQSGISVLVREGFIVGHFDRMKAPLWVAQRWTTFDRERATKLPGLDRPWKEDPELPPYATGGISYSTTETDLDRGHMARHESNRAWGIDSSNWGVKMSNSAPQLTNINRRGHWRDLEDEIRDVVSQEAKGIDAVWTIAGTVFLPDGANTEEYESYFNSIGRLPVGEIAVPYATYKIVAWFDFDGHFQARAYLFPQPYVVSNDGSGLVFEVHEPPASLEDRIVSVDDIEARTGLDFFPNLNDDTEAYVERSVHFNVWGRSN